LNTGSGWFLSIDHHHTKEKRRDQRQKGDPLHFPPPSEENDEVFHLEHLPPIYAPGGEIAICGCFVVAGLWVSLQLPVYQLFGARHG
jgi:hypothetical protein